MSEREAEVAESVAIYMAHRRRRIRIHFLDLILYEVGNALTRRRALSGSEVDDRLEDLLSVCPSVHRLSRAARSDAARLAADHELTFYDAAHWAFARAIRAPLVTADRALIEAGAGVSPTEFTASL